MTGTGRPPEPAASGLRGARTAPGQIRLGAMIYEPATQRLIAPGGAEVFLRWQSTQVLHLLALRCGCLVPRDDLIETVWGDIAVTDDSLTQCIADIRRVLGDQDRSILQTIRKRGYLLSGVREQAHPAAPLPAVPVAPAGPGTGAVPEADEIGARLDPRDVLPTLAVMPLRGPAGPGTDPIGAFVADEITRALARSGEVNIISRLSTDLCQTRAPQSNAQDLRRLLNADFVLSGLVIPRGTRAVLSVEFAETDRGLVLWSDRIESDIGDLLNDDDLFNRIVANIRNAVMINEVQRLRTCPLQDLRLFSALTGAVGLMHRLSPVEFDQARHYLDHVAAHAPGNAAPHAWMARWHVLRVLQGWSEDLRAEADQAMRHCDRALDLEPENTLALTSLGFVKTNLLHDLAAALRLYDTALEINPNDAQGRALRGMLRAFTDEAETGLRDAERALHLTPLDPHRFFYLVLAAGANLSAGDYDRAVVLARESLRLNRTHVSTLRTLAAAQMGAGDGDGARKTVAALLQAQPDLRIGSWLRTAPSARFDNGLRFAALLRAAGVPE